MQISYPASSSGVEIARMPSGAVASMLENEATKNTIFFDDFTAVPFDASQAQNLSTGSPALVSKMSTICKIKLARARKNRMYKRHHFGSSN
jgi:hypothetical protein